MNRSEYIKRVFDLYNEEKISADVYDAMMMNIDDFCDSEDDED